MDARCGGPAGLGGGAQPPGWYASLILDLVCAVSVALWAVLFLRGLLGAKRTHTVKPEKRDRPVVCAFIPARDEAGVIERSVRSVLAQPAVDRVIVVDDGSSDGTGDRVRAIVDPRLSVVDGEGPGDGECGKPAALRFAYQHARPDHEWLLFVDADVVLETDAVGGLLAAADDVDLVTIIPQLRMRTFWEHAIMPSVGALVLAQHPPPTAVFANGQLILVRRTIYDAVGGHGAVAREVLEDVKLAELVHAKGGRLRIGDGRRIATTRMYESWAELSEGWTKNLYLLLGRSRATTIKWVVLSLALGLIGPLCLVLAWWPSGVAAYLAILLMQAVLRAIGGAPWIFAPLAPVGAAGAAWLAWTSMRRHTRGLGVSWKGRTYR